MLSAGSAYPMSLPDVSHEAAEAARHKEETMQYGPLMGLDDLRDCIAAYLAENGVTCSRENILATNGAKHATELPGATVRKPEGGYLLWVELPEGMSGDALAARSVVHGVEVSSGRVCFPTAAAENYLCLAYSFVGPDTMCDGIRRLGIAYQELL